MGRLVLVLLGVLTVATFASTRAADPPSLKGTWVRESMVGPTMGNQVILTFTDHRLTARFRSGGRDPGGHEGWVTFEFEGEYGRTESGLLVGTITGLNVDLSKMPEGDSPGELLGKSIGKMIGEPFCFRARVSDGALTVTDLKVPDVKMDNEHSSREMIAGFASGKYVLSPTENVPVPKLKAAKAMEFRHTRMANNLTAFMWLMSRPRAMFTDQNDLPVPPPVEPQPAYDPPVPGQLPCVVSASPPLPGPMPPPSTMPMPKPAPMPSAMPAPYAMASQPMPTVMPASMVTMPPQPVPQYVSAEVVPGGFFYFRPCRVEEVITMTNQGKSSLPIALPIMPALVPQPAGLYGQIGSIWNPSDEMSMPVYESRIMISSPCWVGTDVMPMAQAMQIPPIDLSVHAMFIPRPLKYGSVGIRGAEPDSRARAEALMFQGFESWQPGALPQLTLSDVDGSITEVPNPSRETMLREIDLGEAGTMQVIVRMKRDKAKPMQPPVPSTLIPTAGQLLPPGSMRNQPVMPAIADAWKNSTRIEGGITPERIEGGIMK